MIGTKNSGELMLRIQEFLERYSERHFDKMTELTEPLLSSLGIEYFHFHHVTNDGRMSFICNNPIFNNHYYSMHESRYNPFLVHSSHLVDGFGLWELLDSPGIEKSRRFYQEKMNIQQMITYVKFVDDGYFHCGFGVPFSNKSSFFIQGKHQFLLEEYLSYFLKEASGILPDINENFVDLHHFIGPHFHQPKKSIKQQKLLEIDTFLQKIGKTCPESPKLTSREKECLSLYMKGHTTQEVANQLFLSPRTVENYFVSVKDKLGVRKKSDVLQHYSRVERLGIAL